MYNVFKEFSKDSMKLPLHFFLYKSLEKGFVMTQSCEVLDFQRDSTRLSHSRKIGILTSLYEATNKSFIQFRALHELDFWREKFKVISLPEDLNTDHITPRSYYWEAIITSFNYHIITMMIEATTISCGWLLWIVSSWPWRDPMKGELDVQVQSASIWILTNSSTKLPLFPGADRGL